MNLTINNRKALAFALAVLAAGAVFADYYWTGADATAPTDWHVAANWYNSTMYNNNCVFGGAHVNDIVSTTVAFTKKVEITPANGLWIENGEKDAIVWQTGDEADEDAGLAITGMLTVVATNWANDEKRVSFSVAGKTYAVNLKPHSFNTVTIK